MLRSLDEPLFALDGAGTTVFVNDRGADLLEADRAALTGEPLLGRLSDRLGSYVQDKLDQAIAAGEETGFETYADPLGSWIRVTAFPFRDGLTVRVREYAEQTGALAPSAVTEGVDGIAVLDDGEFVHVDRDYASAFGFDSDDLVGHDWRRLYDDATTARIETEVLPAVAQRGRWQGELVGESRDGESVEQAVTVSEVADGRVVWTGREITSRKQYGRELAQQRTRIRALFDKSPDGIVVHDADGNVLDANDTECETLGIDREELLSKNVAEFEVGYDREDLKAMWAEMDEGEVLKVEGEHRRSDGEVFPVEIWVNKVIVDGTEQYIALDRDITDRKTRERELRRTREFIEKAQETASIGGWEVDVRDDTLRWTDEVYRIHGVTPDTDVSVTDSFGFYHPDDRDAFVEATARMARDERRGTPEDSYDVEFRVVQPDGTVRWASASAYPVELHDADVFYWVGIIEDVTERRRQQRRLEAVAERVDEVIRVASPDLSEVLYVSPGYEDLWGRPVEELDDDPLAFRPERWDDETDRPAYAYLPFGAGPRSCLGRAFALTEAKIVLATVLRDFELDWGGDGELAIAPEMTTQPKGETPLVVRRR